MTDKRLCTFKLKNSLTCSLSSWEDGTEFHNVFSCRAFDDERAILGATMKSLLIRILMTGVTFGTVLSLMVGTFACFPISSSREGAFSHFSPLFFATFANAGHEHMFMWRVLTFCFNLNELYKSFILEYSFLFLFCCCLVMVLSWEGLSFRFLCFWPVM